jgi:hypothetical protein
MEPDTVAVPLWFIQLLVGTLVTGLLGAIGVGIKAIIDLGSLRQLLIGIDGKNGIRGDLQLLDATVENMGHDIVDLAMKMTEDHGRLGRVEKEVERYRGFAA